MKNKQTNIACLNNLMEIRGDAFKLINTSQRPYPHSANSIGPWLQCKKKKIKKNE